MKLSVAQFLGHEMGLFRPHLTGGLHETVL